MTMFKHRYFAGDVQIMSANSETAFNHRCTGGGKRPSAVQHQLDAMQGNQYGALVIKIKYSFFQIQLCRQRLKFIAAAAGKNGLQPQTYGFASNQLTGVTVSTINHPLHRSTP